MDCSTPDFPVIYGLLEFSQIQLIQISDIKEKKKKKKLRILQKQFQMIIVF